MGFQLFGEQLTEMVLSQAIPFLRVRMSGFDGHCAPVSGQRPLRYLQGGELTRPEGEWCLDLKI